MKKIFDRILVNPKICIVHPTISGMRIIIAFIKMLTPNITYEAILEAYLGFERNDILQAVD